METGFPFRTLSAASQVLTKSQTRNGGGGSPDFPTPNNRIHHMKTTHTHADSLSEIDGQIASLIDGLETLNTVQIIDGLNTVREALITTEMMIRRDADQEAITESLANATIWLIKAECGPVIEDEPAPCTTPADAAECPVATNEGEPHPVCPPVFTRLYGHLICSENPEEDPAVPTPYEFIQEREFIEY